MSVKKKKEDTNKKTHKNVEPEYDDIKKIKHLRGKKIKQKV